MRVIGKVLRAIHHSVALRWRPRFLEPSPTGGSYGAFPNLPVIDPSDELTIRRVEVARHEGFNEGSEYAYRCVNLAWRNRWWWRRLYSRDLSDRVSRLEHVFRPVVNRWFRWRHRRELVSPTRQWVQP